MERLSNVLAILSLTFCDKFSANPRILEMNSSGPSSLVLLT